MKPIHAAALFFALSLPAIPLACSGGAPDAHSACNDLARARCEKIAQCNAIEMESSFANDMNACIAAQGPSCNDAFTVKGVGVTPSTVESCANAIRAQSCASSANDRTPAACAAPAGTLANGVSCYEDDQCKGGLCYGTSFGNGPTAPACGTCTTKPTHPGCQLDSECPADQVCYRASFGPTTGGTCMSPLAAGAACEAGQTAPCRAELVCQPSDGGAAGTCEAPPPLPGAGQPCAAVASLGYFCANGLACNGTTCVAPQFVPIGGACPPSYSAGDGGVQICAGGECRGGACVAYAAVGSTCATSGGYPTGAPCTPGSYCVSGKCAQSASTPAPTCN